MFRLAAKNREQKWTVHPFVCVCVLNVLFFLSHWLYNPAFFDMILRFVRAGQKNKVQLQLYRFLMFLYFSPFHSVTVNIIQFLCSLYWNISNETCIDPSYLTGTLRYYSLRQSTHVPTQTPFTLTCFFVFRTVRTVMILKRRPAVQTPGFIFREVTTHTHTHTRARAHTRTRTPLLYL